MIDISTCVFLVEGQSEIRSLNEKFPKEFGHKPNIRKICCNGSSVSPQSYVNAAYGTIFLTLSKAFRFIVIILDRERRRITAFDLAERIRKEIVKRIVSSSKFKPEDIEAKIVVFVPDIMFENWIVADVVGIQSLDFVKGGVPQENFDGRSGCSILRKLLSVNYRKTLHAPRLFKAVRFHKARLNSPSFRVFHDFLLS